MAINNDPVGYTWGQTLKGILKSLRFALNQDKSEQKIRLTKFSKPNKHFDAYFRRFRNICLYMRT